MRLRFILFVLSLLAFLCAVAGGYFYYSSLRDAFFDAAEQEAIAHVQTTNNLISQHISDYTRLADILSSLWELRMALADPNDETLGHANGILDHFQKGARADVCYVMDQRGQTIASSNRFEADSFVGKDYSFRPYFQEAMSGGSGVYLALGVTSERRGIYFSHPVVGQDSQVPIGVAVIKGSAEDMGQRLFRRNRPAHDVQKGMLFIVDPLGVIFFSDPKELLLKTLWKTDAIGQMKIAETRQFGKGPWGRSGTGLGMSVVWGTVKDHHGYIDVDSREGEGTTFALYFPATRKAKGREKPRLSFEHYKGRGESILIVDDVEQQREIASEMLKGFGYSVAAVSSGEEAVEYVKTNPVDLLVLDMIMDPGMDGLETYRQIIRFRPGQKAVIASGFSDTDRVKEAQRLGAGAYVKKPFLSDKIGPAIRRELDKE